jgi:hypothetical protein
MLVGFILTLTLFHSCSLTSWLEHSIGLLLLGTPRLSIQEFQPWINFSHVFL